ncbi:uncharacterized protein EI90DRAFT_1533647 [Cantharellus anzutake]|uniref:uncharacterized protein n=1 Tax=Cantharellus anzutake TaxID=1750568 RepID=UPI00190721FE|nr:uncharacterized protein EI90DRAFT_2681747 [Cantharellus anzutake]XP_038914309.1 uncharacterized protein EI90DRAFT_1533647 [Cantharellus anzutake]KAF8319219.1 hypothetical protein EI90DRAFT_2681747 [Cantharellus anzutake]KAF8328545.1 hypothetical protein EI90DRAFT_1533647 [Cantharellus anzutake]
MPHMRRTNTTFAKGQTGVMPRPLQILDILTVLFDCCSNATLASAARTCKLWMIPALRRLWRVLDTPVPLLRLLGSVDNADSLFYRLSTVMDLEALPRIQFYAKFVQSITVVIGDWSNHIHPELMDEFTLAVQFLHPHLFSHLISLDCYLYGSRAIRSAGIWLAVRSPKISLSFRGPPDATCLPLIRSLCHHSASLTSLSLYIGETSGFREALNECFVNALKPLVNIVSLTATGGILLTPTVWTCIAQLPNVKEVRSPSPRGFDFRYSAWHDFGPPALDTPFPSLHTIEMAIPSQLAVIVLGYYPLSGSSR